MRVASRYTAVPSVLNERVHSVEVYLEERGQRGTQGLLDLAVKVNNKT